MKRYCSLILLSFLIVFGISNAKAGILYFSEDYNSSGLYALDTTTGAATSLGITGVSSATVGLAPSANPTLLYGSTWTDINLINADGSGASLWNIQAAEGLAFDPTSGLLYAAINAQFGAIDTTTGIYTSLAIAPADVEGLAYANGYIYGLEGFGGSPKGDLWRYDIGAASWSFLNNVGVAFNLPGLAYNPGLDIFYAKGSQDSYLYSIDTTTWTAAVIGDTGLYDGGGLAYTVPEPATLALLASGLAGLGFSRRRKNA